MVENQTQTQKELAKSVQSQKSSRSKSPSLQIILVSLFISISGSIFVGLLPVEASPIDRLLLGIAFFSLSILIDMQEDESQDIAFTEVLLELKRKNEDTQETSNTSEAIAKLAIEKDISIKDLLTDDGSVNQALLKQLLDDDSNDNEQES